MHDQSRRAWGRNWVTESSARGTLTVGRELTELAEAFAALCPILKSQDPQRRRHPLAIGVSTYS